MTSQKNTAATARSLAKKLGGWLEVTRMPSLDASCGWDVELVTIEDGTIWNDGSGAHSLMVGSIGRGETKSELWREVCDHLRMLLDAGVHPEPGYADGEEMPTDDADCTLASQPESAPESTLTSNDIIHNLQSAARSLGTIDGSTDAMSIGTDANVDAIVNNLRVYVRVSDNVAGCCFATLPVALRAYALAYRVAVRMRAHRRARIGLPL